jgi:hypothetical protein
MMTDQPPSERSQSGRVARLSDRLENLENQLGRLTDLLSEQAKTRNRRRRQLTLRLLLLAFVGFGAVFAWFGHVYRLSLRQAFAVDQLISQSAFVYYQPREDLLVSMLPGEVESPPRMLNKALGDDFFRAVTNVSTNTRGSIKKDKQQIIKAVSSLPQLERLRLASLNLRTGDLNSLHWLSELQSLDLNRTGLDAGSMPWLQSTRLRWFNAAHTRVGDRLLYDLSQCPDLQHLDLERTSISDAGLKYLYQMPQLRYLNLKRAPVSKAAVEQLSAALPSCLIEWEPLRFLPGGRVDVATARRGRMRLGQPIPPDPRVAKRPAAPLDRAPNTTVAVPYRIQGRTQVINQSYSGFVPEPF